MTGLMMDYPLTLTHILERSAKIYPSREIASRVDDGSMHRYTYRDFHRRVHRLAHALEALGMEPGDRIVLSPPVGISDGMRVKSNDVDQPAKTDADQPGSKAAGERPVRR